MASLKEFADEAIASVKDVDLIREAETRGYLIHKPKPPREPAVLDTSKLRGDRVRIGIISDTHFGSKFQQPTLMQQDILYMKKQKCSAILVPGDVTDGSTKMHAGFEYELWAQTADAQIEAAVQGFPDVGIPYYLIGGNHDASHFKAAGVDVVQHIANRRDDFTYLGPELDSHNFRGSVGYVEIGDVLIQLCHPHMGSTRTRSYRLETWIENLQPPRPRIVVMGNFHKLVEIMFHGTWGLLVPSYQAQTAWMASKAIESVVGGCIVEFGTVTKGLAPSLNIEWLWHPEPIDNDHPGR